MTSAGGLASTLNMHPHGRLNDEVAPVPQHHLHVHRSPVTPPFSYPPHVASSPYVMLKTVSLSESEIVTHCFTHPCRVHVE